MTVILQQVMPEGVTLQMLDDVTDEMGAGENPPEGMLVHTHFESDGRVHVVDIWDSEQAYESFRESRLLPAMQTVAQRNGMEGELPQAESSVSSVHRTIRGRS